MWLGACAPASLESALRYVERAGGHDVGKRGKCKLAFLLRDQTLLFMIIDVCMFAIVVSLRPTSLRTSPMQLHASESACALPPGQS